MNTEQILGFVGSVVLFVGLFAPVVNRPDVVNYFQAAKGLTAVLAIVSFVLVLVKKYQGLWLTGGGVLAVLTGMFINFRMEMSSLVSQVGAARNGGLKDIWDLPRVVEMNGTVMEMRSVQLEWGIALLLVGCGLLIAAAVMQESAINKA